MRAIDGIDGISFPEPLEQVVPVEWGIYSPNINRIFREVSPAHIEREGQHHVDFMAPGCFHPCHYTATNPVVVVEIISVQSSRLKQKDKMVPSF